MMVLSSNDTVKEEVDLTLEELVLDLNTKSRVICRSEILIMEIYPSYANHESKLDKCTSGIKKLETENTEEGNDKRAVRRQRNKKRSENGYI